MNGFLAVNKPKGPTSHDVVERVSRVLATICGHAGTLDPAAEGVLVLGVGDARKFIRYLLHDKAYDGELLLGVESDTLDLEGALTAPRAVTATEEAVRAAGEGLTGTVELAVPAFSAVKVKGRRLHEAARAGEAVVPPVRAFRVEELRVTAVAFPRVRFHVECAGGTYVRSLAAEWGRRLGCGAVLAGLVRTRSGAFRLGDAVTLDALEGPGGRVAAEAVLVPPAAALAHLPAAVLPPEVLHRIWRGQALPLPDGVAPVPATLVRLLPAPAGPLAGLGVVAAAAGAGLVLKAERMAAADPSAP